MPCVSPPPPQVAAVIEVGPAPSYPLAFTAADPTSANYLTDAQGDWDFSCFKGPIKVRLTIATPGKVFYYGGGRDSVSFAYDPATQAKQPIGRGHRQFPGNLQHVTAQSIWFSYANAWDCGAGDNQRRCAKSAYGIYVGDSHGGFTVHADPIIQNGGGKS
jgi:hypothetical protein